MNMTAARSPLFLSVNDGTWVPHQPSAQAVIPTVRHPPPIHGFSPIPQQQPDFAFGSPIMFREGQHASITLQHQGSPQLYRLGSSSQPHGSAQ
jgi:hypothetical protein